MKQKRLVFIDLLRFLAIFLMFWDHAIKLFYNFDRANWQGPFFNNLSTSILLITPLSASLFLFLVGFCLCFSFHRKKQTKKLKWVFRKILKGVVLIALSFFLYYFRYDPGLTKIPATSGILQLIGSSYILIPMIMFLPKLIRLPLFLTLIITSPILDHVLRTGEVAIPLLNVLSFPFLPYITYVLGGILLAEGYRYFQKSPRKKIFFQGLAWSSLATIGFFLAFSNFDPLLIFRSYISIENHRLHSSLMVLYNLSIIVLVFSTLVRLEKLLSRIKLLKIPALIGKEALGIYVFHILLGWGASRYFLKEARFGFTYTLSAVLIFCLIGWGYAMLKKRFITTQ
ncbi:acyltransferase family protein [Patescibacteria group bacterium]